MIAGTRYRDSKPVITAFLLHCEEANQDRWHFPLQQLQYLMQCFSGFRDKK